jgi:hypothetical protein
VIFPWPLNERLIAELSLIILRAWQSPNCCKCGRALGDKDYRTLCRRCNFVPVEIPAGALVKTNPGFLTLGGAS